MAAHVKTLQRGDEIKSEEKYWHEAMKHYLPHLIDRTQASIWDAVTFDLALEEFLMKVVLSQCLGLFLVFCVHWLQPQALIVFLVRDFPLH